MGKVLRTIVLLGVLIIVVGIMGTLGVGHLVYSQVTQVTPREVTIENRDQGREAFEASLARYATRSVSIPSQTFDYEIPALLVEVDGAQDWAVVIHGLGGTKEVMGDTIQHFLREGVNVLAYDQRNSGDHPASSSTGGLLESFDAIDCSRYLQDQVGVEGNLFLYGVSYGGATAAIASGRQPHLWDGIILECPLSDKNILIDEVLAQIEAEDVMPASYMRFSFDCYARIRGFRPQDMNANTWIAMTQSPVLIFRTLADKATPPPMGEDLYEAIPHSHKRLVTSQDADHALIYLQDPDLYFEAFQAFIEAPEALGPSTD